MQSDHQTSLWRRLRMGLAFAGALALAACNSDGGGEPASSAIPDNVVRIHYARTQSDSADWGLHLWEDAKGSLDLPRAIEWASPWLSTSKDDYGAIYDIPMKAGAKAFNFILHKGDEKNCPSDQRWDAAAAGRELWLQQGDCTLYKVRPAVRVGDVSQAKAHWLTPSIIVWPGAAVTDRYALVHAAEGGITSGREGISGGTSVGLQVESAGLADDLKARHPHLANATALRLPAELSAKAPELLKGQLVMARFDVTGRLLDSTALQTAGVLDALYAGAAQAQVLGAAIQGGVPTFRLWAPTARSVELLVFDAPSGGSPDIRPMHQDAASGTWSVVGDAAMTNRQYYLYRVKVYVRSTGKVETNMVTDPYSLGLSANSERSMVVDLESALSQPAGWSAHAIPSLAGIEDISLYELHVRDFSASDFSVPVADRGKFLAFSHASSAGMRHLKTLAAAGLTHVHLLPVNDLSSIQELPALQQLPAISSADAADSENQQAAVAAVADRDAYNWGYDPLHYTVPEGSYASDPNGLARIRELRSAIAALHNAGLRVVLDVVYNHTPASGQDGKSVLDRIVPGYYHRLSANGSVETSSCCANTATENVMMAKLMIDSTKVWAAQYKVDGFRFDLMGHQPLSVMQQLQREVNQAAGRDIYIYGEGWNFGEVQNNARFKQASQQNLAGTGIGSFSDRLRDAVRGGGPFDGGDALIRNQGFVNGLCFAPNDGLACDAVRRTAALHQQDLIRLGLAGNLRDFTLQDHSGNSRRGAAFDYNGAPAGYTQRPQEQIAYISAHDNQTLFDISQYKHDRSVSSAERARAQAVGLSLIAFSQGIPFFHAGDELLRSKSLERDSYNAGDWFNRIDWTYQANNWGVGLPSKERNGDNWSIMKPLLTDTTLAVKAADITFTYERFLDWLKIRRSSSLFRLASLEQVQSRVSFPDVLANRTPGVIVMRLDGRNLSGSQYKAIYVVFNASTSAVTSSLGGGIGNLALHPTQQSSSDPIVRTATYSAERQIVVVPARTTAVFVETDA